MYYIIHIAKNVVYTRPPDTVLAYPTCSFLAFGKKRINVAVLT